MSIAVEEFRDSHLHSILKAFSWRIVATLTTGLIAYGITGELDTAIMIGGIEFLLKIFIYYLHERAWQILPRTVIGAVARMRTRIGSPVTRPIDPP
jgi:uncharacterized membrane protein